MPPKPPPYHGTSDADPVREDRYAAESNTWRRMKGWQIVGLIAGIIILALLLWMFV